MFEIEIIKDKISQAKLKAVAKSNYGNMVKLVVDLRRKNFALGGEMHADAEQILLSDGAKQEDLWGANIYPDEPVESRLEYDSLINIRPRAGNRSTTVEDTEIKVRIKEIIDSLIEE